MKAKVGDLVLSQSVDTDSSVGLIAEMLRKRFVSETGVRTLHYALVLSAFGLKWYCTDELRLF